MVKETVLSVEQNAAVQPTMNIVVQANAGTGKTFVLIQRLLRLLFREYKNNGHDQSQKSIGILCLTYTNAGAAEMRNRILSAMLEWARADDSELKLLLTGIAHNNPPTIDDVYTARKIFYDFIDNPGTLKIQTIHSFAEDILRRFPIEANVPPAWRLVSGAEQKRLLKDAFAEMLNQNQTESVQNAFDNILSLTSEYSLDDLLQSILSQYKYILSLKHNPSFLDHLIERTEHFLQVDSPIEKPDYDGDVLEILTQTGEIRKKLTPAQLQVAESVRQWDQYQKNQKIMQVSNDFLTLCNTFTDTYVSLKMKRGLLDFDDMLHKVKLLFKNPTVMGQVLSELDFYLKHILIDESQDNSPIMWDIIFSMLDDFWTDGEQNPRTLFVVGDVKQSIFSFQGASPEQFAKISDKVKAITKNELRQYDTVPLLESRRTVRSVLDVVDFFFNNANLPGFDKNIEHKAWRKDDFGLVEIDPLFLKKDDEDTNLTRKRFIKNIAQKIENLIKNENVKDNDIMVLVQRREPFASMLIRELKQRNITTAGSDRIILSNFPAIRDLLNVIRFAVSPNNKENDASLAFVLRSPLFRFSEKELGDICINRNLDISLFETVKNKLPDIYQELRKITDISYQQPYTFLSEIMNKYRADFISAMGRVAIEPLDEFMTLALSYERTKSGGLIGFLRWFLDGENEIRRDMEKGNGVRILTAHSSKGLEAPVVFLIDTTKNPKSQTNHLPFNVFNPQPDVFLCKAGDVDTDMFQVAKEIDLNKRTEEYWRLFYVAMTRARDRLYVMGCEEKNKNESWHSKIYEIIQKMPQVVTSVDGILTVSGGTKINKIDDKEIAKQVEVKKLTIPSKVLIQESYNTFKPTQARFEINSLNKKKYALKQGTNVHKELEVLDADSDSDLASKISSNPSLKKFWGRDSRAEVPIAGYINGKFYSLRIDRLIETSESVEFLDYKTDISRERRDEYIEKMRLYAALLSQIFPGRNIIGHILWLSTMELEDL